MSDLPQIRSTVSDILGFRGQATSANAAATGADFSAQGAAAQETAYNTAAQIAQQNAGLEEMSGRIQELQAEREVARSMGTFTAGAASAGLATSGSVLSGLRNSYMQGRLTDQLISTQTAINQGGFLEQSAAATGEAGAAAAAYGAARALAAAERSAAGTATGNAASETAALMGFLSSTGVIGGTPGNPLFTNLSPAAAVELSPLAGTGGVPNLPTPSWFMGPNGQWTYGVQGATTPGGWGGMQINSGGQWGKPQPGITGIGSAAYFGGVGSPGGDFGALAGTGGFGARTG